MQFHLCVGFPDFLPWGSSNCRWSWAQQFFQGVVSLQGPVVWQFIYTFIKKIACSVKCLTHKPKLWWHKYRKLKIRKKLKGIRNAQHRGIISNVDSHCNRFKSRNSFQLLSYISACNWCPDSFSLPHTVPASSGHPAWAPQEQVWVSGWVEKKLTPKADLEWSKTFRNRTHLLTQVWISSQSKATRRQKPLKVQLVGQLLGRPL